MSQNLSPDDERRFERVSLLTDLSMARQVLQQALRTLERAGYPTLHDVGLARYLNDALGSVEDCRLLAEHVAHEGLDNPRPGE